MAPSDANSSIYFARQPETAIGNPQWAGDAVPGSCDQLRGVHSVSVAADRSTAAGQADRVYLTWAHLVQTAHGLGNEILFAYSHSAGADFLDGTSPVPTVLAPAATGEAGLSHPTVAVGPLGDVYTIWTRERIYDENFPHLNNRFEIRTSTNGGVSFGSTQELPFTINDVEDYNADFFTRFDIDTYASIAVDLTDCDTAGTIYVAFAAAMDETDDDTDILVTRSVDGGQTWDVPVNLVHETEGQYGPYQFFPAVAVDDFGQVVVIWLDDRESGSAHDEYAVYMNYSTDGGDTWETTNERVMDAGETSPTYLELGGDRLLDLGSRIGLSARGDTFYGVWTDLRYWTDPDEDYYDLWDVGDVFLGRIRLPVADFDYDRDCDISDFGIFMQCFGGASNPPAPSCPDGVDADLDGDGDVDTADFAIFGQKYYNKPAPHVRWCPSVLVGEGMMGGSDGETDDDAPTVDELTELLKAYCKEHGIPYT